MNSKPSWGTQPPHKSENYTEFMGGRASHENWPPKMLEQIVFFIKKLKNEAPDPLIDIAPPNRPRPIQWNMSQGLKIWIFEVSSPLQNASPPLFMGGGAPHEDTP